MKQLIPCIACLCLSFSAFSQRTFLQYFSENIPFTESYDIIQTSDGGFLVAGSTRGTNANIDVYVIKTNANGETDWMMQQDYDNGVLADVGISVAELEDSFVLLGYTLSQLDLNIVPLLVFINKGDGNITNFYRLEELLEFHSYQIIPSDDDKVLILGETAYRTEEHNARRITIAKINSLGHVQWENTFEDSSNGGADDFYYGGLEKSELGEIYFGQGGTNLDSVLVINFDSERLIVGKTDEQGELIWLNEVPQVSEATDITLTTNSVVASSRFAYDVGRGILTSFSQEDGTLLWQKDYDEIVDDIAGCVANSKDELLCAAHKGDDFVLLKTDIDGNYLWHKVIEASGTIRKMESRSVVLTEDEGVTVTGNIVTTTSNNLPAGIFVLRLNADGELGEISSTNHLSIPNFNIQTYPNPVTEYLTIENQATDTGNYDLTLCDSKGTIHYQGQLRDTQTQIPMQHLASGAYIVSLRNVDNQIWNKMVVKK